MPLTALVFYLESKHKHETIRDVYITDMLRFAAWGHVKNPDKLPRYWDSLQSTQKVRTPREQFTENDVIDMFKGKGALVKG